MKKSRAKRTGKTIMALTALCILFAVWVPAVFGEAAGFTSSVVWRNDDKGDLVMPEIKDGICETRISASADGLIKKVTVTWESEGEVMMEISADGGMNYFEAVNGVPAKEGLSKGDRIKWRARLKEKSTLTEVRVSYLDSLNIKAGFGTPELSGFRYRRKIEIKGGGSELYNYQVKVKIGESVKSKGSDVHCGGNLKRGFDDIRFTAADGETMLPHYLEKVTGNIPERVAEFWVKVPQIPSEGVAVYVYYSNASAKDLSSSEKVFEKPDGTTDSTLKRKYADIEPEVIEGRSYAEETVSLPIFRGTALSASGDIIIKDGYEQGEYVSREINAAFPVRILIPSWQGQGIKIDVSADGGKSYKNDCSGNSYYYASREDFYAGTKPVIRARLETGTNTAVIEHIELDYQPGRITVISPNGGEEWTAGTTRDILWSALEYDFFYPIKIEYSRNGGMVYRVMTESTDNDGIYSWKIPEEEVSREMVIRVSDANERDVSDVSDRAFGVIEDRRQKSEVRE